MHVVRLPTLLEMRFTFCSVFTYHPNRFFLFRFFFLQVGVESNLLTLSFMHYSQKASQGQNEETPATTQINSTMVYEGALEDDSSSASPPTCTGSGLIAGAVSIGTALLTSWLTL